MYEWVHKISSSVISIDVIKNDHSLFCTEIDHLISEILLGRGDFSLVGEFGNLNDKLDAAKREAIQTARESISRVPSSTPINQATSTITSSNTRTSNLDDVFNANDEIEKGGGKQRVNLSSIPDPSNTSSSNTVVGRDMRSNIILDHNSPRRRNILNPDINPLRNDSGRNAQTLLGILYKSF